MYPVFGKREFVWTKREPVLPAAYFSRQEPCILETATWREAAAKLIGSGFARSLIRASPLRTRPASLAVLDRPVLLRSIEIFNLSVDHLRIFNYRAERRSSPTDPATPAAVDGRNPGSGPPRLGYPSQSASSTN